MGKKNCWTCNKRKKIKIAGITYCQCPQKGDWIGTRESLTSEVCDFWEPRPTSSRSKSLPKSLPKPTNNNYATNKNRHNYIERVSKDLLALIEYAYANDIPLALEGHAGCGKTEAIRYFASKHGIPLYRANLNGLSTTDDLLGKYIILNGSMSWVDGIVTKALREGGILLLEELNAAEPEVLFCLHSLLDESRQIVLIEKDCEIVTKHPDTRIFATLNPTSPLYPGTRVLNFAFLDRFPLWIKMNYLTASKEREILEKNGVEPNLARKITLFAKEWRKGFRKGELPFPLSTRRIIAWAKLIPEFGIYESAKISFLGLVEEEMLGATEILLKGIFEEVEMNLGESGEEENE